MDHHVWLFNLGTTKNPQTIKLNVALVKPIAINIEALPQIPKHCFRSIRTFVHGIMLTWKEFHHKLLNITLSSTPLSHLYIHQAKYRMSPNYVIVVKQNLDKLLSVKFIAPVEEISWLSPIVIVSKKNGDFGFVWISNDSMLLPRRIHILYPLLKKCWTKLQVMRSICFLMNFSIITRSWSPLKISTRLHSSPIGELSFGWSCHSSSRMLHQLINRWWV
jgi:hypothetical protein